MNHKLKKRVLNSKTSILERYYLTYKYLNADLSYAIKKYATGRLLDIGCGNKPYYEDIMKVCQEYVGSDIEQSSENKVDVICPATNFPLKDNEFDTVLCTQVLEHVFDHNKVIQEANRLLKKDRYFIASLPMAWPHHEEPYDFFRFTKYGIKELLEKNNFQIEYIKNNGGKWALLGQMINLTFLTNRTRGPLTKLKYIIYRLTFMKVIVNFIFGSLDKLSKDTDYNTLNFLFVAKKL